MKLFPKRPDNLATCQVERTERGRPRLCSNTVPPGMFVCGDCANELAVALLFVAHTGHALEAAYLKQQRFSTQRLGRANVDESPVPWNEKAASARDELLRTLTEAADAIATKRQLFRPLNTWEALGRWLAEQVSWMRAQPDGPDMHRHLIDRLRAADRVVDAPSMRAFVGRCPTEIADDDGNTTTCDTELWAPPGRYTSDVKCRACGTAHPIADRRRSLLGRADDMLLPRTDLARALSGFGVEITPKQLENWTTRGRLSTHGYTNTRPGRPLYRVGDVLDLLAADRARRSVRSAH